MSNSDPIAECLTRIRNAQGAKHRFVDIDLSKMKVSIANILRDNGFIENFIQNDAKGKMRIFLKYTNERKGIIRKIKRVSKPGRRIYLPVSKIPRILAGIGIAIISTSKGVIDDNEARKLKVGGEILCYIW
ncbi:MAG: 30S ribosomal protein S8 [Candidatus Anoxychlamydiales bacterium]|nr:30S ribosomal protein S8 [Candidatus Anoxychlamydiales bacterium]NGX35335.1 30S ribosomal protein S8 [Candidatus Anoxychlamydiales bacterium]